MTRYGPVGNANACRERRTILYISHSAGKAGAEQVLINLVKSLDKDKFDPIVVLPGPGLLHDELSHLGVETVKIPIEWWMYFERSGSAMRMETVNLFKRSEELANLIVQRKVDIVHTNTSVTPVGAIAAKMTGKPHVWHLHEVVRGHPTLRQFIPLYLVHRFMELFSEKIVTVSNFVRSAISDDIAPELIQVIHNYIDLKESDGDSSAEDLRREFCAADDEIFICTVASVVKEKGYHTLLEAAQKVLQKNDKVRFVSMGARGDDIIYLRHVDTLLMDDGCSGHFRMLGYRSDARNFLDAADLCVVPSESEAFSLVAVEAMAMGTPVIATRCGGPEEIVQDGDTGLLVPKNDPEALAEAILELASEPLKRQKMGLRGKDLYFKRFTAEIFSRHFEALYDSLSNKRRLIYEDEKMSAALMELFIKPDVFQIKSSFEHSPRKSSFEKLLDAINGQNIRKSIFYIGANGFAAFLQKAKEKLR